MISIFIYTSFKFNKKRGKKEVTSHALEFIIPKISSKSSENQSNPLREYVFGGTVWESNPPETSRASLKVLKTSRDTSTLSDPIDKSQIPL